MVEVIEIVKDYGAIGKLESSYPHPVSMNGTAVPFSGDVTGCDGSNCVGLSFGKTASFELDICKENVVHTA